MLFELGHVTASPEVRKVVAKDDIVRALLKHALGHWGDIPADKRAQNELSIKLNHQDIASSYLSSKGVRFCISTNMERTSTCIMLSQKEDQ